VAGCRYGAATNSGEQYCGELDSLIDFQAFSHAGGHDRACRDADEGMNGVPTTVDARCLVGDKLKKIHDACDTQHQRVLQDFQCGRQYHMSGVGQDTEHEHCGIQVNARRPRGTER